MSVYVDNARIPYGRMFMSHMLADTEIELHEMARRLNLRRSWFQKSNNGKVPHYDICQAKRAQAISLGAVAINRKQLAEFTKTRKIRCRYSTEPLGVIVSRERLEFKKRCAGSHGPLR